MTALMVNARSKTLLAWGIFDALYSVGYGANSLLSARIPYISDWNSFVELAPDHGSAGVALMAASGVLQVSIVFSCILFLLRIRQTKYLAYAQTPFRLFLLIPSLSLILVAARFMPEYSMVFLVLIVISEAVKGWSLWRYA